MLPAPFFILAQAGELPITSKEYALVSLAVVAVFLVILTLLTIWVMLRRQPPIEREIDDRINERIAQFERRFDKKIDALERNISAWQSTMQAGFSDLHRAIGRIEGNVHKPEGRKP